MKMDAAIKIIKGETKAPGFMVHFEEVDGCILRSNHFPEITEPLIANEAEAWLLAHEFAKKTTGRYVNIYVTDSEYRPVLDYAAKQIKNR